jgi:beta-glucosidase
MFQSPEYHRGGLVVRAPNADIGRDIRWGRTEECYGEDAWFNAQLTVEFIKGLQGDHPKYWKTASLMKHFLANSNENGRDSTSSNFNDRLFREYYSYPFYKGVTEGGSRAYMTAYNSYNGIPCTVHPMLKSITIDQWGQNGIICTDGGAYRLCFRRINIVLINMLQQEPVSMPELTNFSTITAKVFMAQLPTDNSTKT